MKPSFVTIEDTEEIMAMRGNGCPVVFVPSNTALTWNGAAFDVPKEINHEQAAA